MPTANLENVIVLALRRRGFCSELANDVDRALQKIGWVLPAGDLQKLKAYLPTPLSQFKNNPTLMDMLKYLSYLSSDEVKKHPIEPDNFPVPQYNQIPGIPENPPGGWQK